MKNIPYEKRYAANTWQTSNEIFKPTRVGNLELVFPAFSKSKIFSVRPDIVIVDKEPIIDLILGRETFAEFGTMLDFQDKKLQIDHAKIAMRPLICLGVNI